MSLSPTHQAIIDRAVANCYPMPDFEAPLMLPLFEKPMVMDPTQVGEVADEDFSLWVAKLLSGQSFESTQEGLTYRDYARYWASLEVTHRRAHRMLERAAADPGATITGSYLSLLYMHEGITSLMGQVREKMEALSASDG